MNEPQTSEEWVVFLHDQYIQTGNPLHLLGAFCHLPADVDGNKSVPRWMALALDNGFNTYLTGLTAGGPYTLEAALGISKGVKIERTSLDKMVDYVHLYRWLFGLKSNISVHAVYMKYKIDIGESGLELSHQGMTRDERGFQQYYDRGAKAGYPAWLAAIGSREPTDEDRAEELLFLDDATARYVRTRSAYCKSR
jgi:hypothetical protein